MEEQAVKFVKDSLANGLSVDIIRVTVNRFLVDNKYDAEIVIRFKPSLNIYVRKRPFCREFPSQAQIHTRTTFAEIARSHSQLGSDPDNKELPVVAQAVRLNGELMVSDKKLEKTKKWK